MFDIINKTPFLSSSGLLLNQHGENIICAVVKGCFDFPDQSGSIKISESQVPPFHSEQYFDSPENSGIRYPADFVPEKINSDIGLNGCVYSNKNKPAMKTTACLRVGNNHKKIIAFGDREWKRSLFLKKYKIKQTDSFRKMSIDCNKLFGGQYTDKRGDNFAFEPNPHGLGFYNYKNKTFSLKLPNFENPDHKINRIKQRPLPATFGYTSSAWPHRVKYAGTYDEEWKLKQSPLYPLDIDSRFFNSAQPELINDGFLKGNEKIELTNLTPCGFKSFNIPTYNVSFYFKYKNTIIFKKGDIHTLTIEPENKNFLITWGCFFKIGNRPSEVEYIKAIIED